MRIITFTLEQEAGHTYIFSDLFGFYLWSTDLERALGSVVPLSQHLIWRNELICMAPTEEPDFTILHSVKIMMIPFEIVDRLQAPALLVKGRWWETPAGKSFFVPFEGKMMSTRVGEKIEEDLKKLRTG